MIWCLLTVVIESLIMLWALRLVLKTDVSGRGLARDGKAALRAFQNARNRSEKIGAMVLFGVAALRVGLWGFMGAFATGVMSAVASICGWVDWLQLRGILADFYRFILTLVGRYPSGERIDGFL